MRRYFAFMSFVFVFHFGSQESAGAMTPSQAQPSGSHASLACCAKGRPLPVASSIPQPPAGTGGPQMSLPVAS